MATARQRQISLTDTPYYHCISRCVRRAFLCGEDNVSGKSYEHRRVWIEEKLLSLSKSFAIDVCAYAVMSNHFHVVLYIDQEAAKRWSTSEVLERWHHMFKGTLLTRRYMKEGQLEEYLMPSLLETVEVYRNRLMDISWFMRQVNEPIARQANREDGCTGRFWEGRFKSQALLDEAALAACMAYVELNPIRANIADVPERSDYTSVKKRIESAQLGQQPNRLLPFVGNPKRTMPIKGLPFELQDYLQLVELTGRCIKAGKAGYINEQQPAILVRLAICPENWLTLTTTFTKVFSGAAGKRDELTKFCQHQQIKRRHNIEQCSQLLA
ncbi:transposase [Thalassotalea ganghwensis]